MSEDERAPLCTLCRVKRYAKGQWLRETYWSNCVSMMLEGLCAEIGQASAGRAVTLDLDAAGSLLSMSELFVSSEERDINDFPDTLCLTDCTIAVFNAEDVRQLMQRNPKFVTVVLKHCVREKLPERTEMLLHLGFGDAKDSVGYILDYLREHGIDYLTHEQIALICNRSRQTVTSTINRLT